jgi:phenylacetate-CoA ligase
MHHAELKRTGLFYLGKGIQYKIVKRVLTPYQKYRKFLEKSQWWSKEELDNYQANRLRVIVEAAYRNTPYYKALFDIFDIRPKDIQSLDDFKKVPILEKEDVRRNYNELISDKATRGLLYEAHTSGSTGKPLRVYRDLDNIGFEHAALMRQWKWAGLDHNDRYASLKGDLFSFMRIRREIYWAYSPVEKKLHMSSYHISAENAKHYLAALRKYNIVAIEGYPSSLFALAKYLLAKNIKYSLKSILTTSETIVPIQRSIIEEAFQCKVFDYYGMAERVAAIHTCEKESYHLIPEYSLTELVESDETSPGHFELIGTSLSNMAMPLIRFRIGDVVRPGNKKCACGRAYPVIDKIVGRTDDYVITPSGKLIGRLDHIFKGINNVIEAQIYQPDTKNLILRIVPDPTFSDKDSDQIIEKLQDRVGEDMRFSVEQVESIEREGSGKLKSVLSEVSVL